MAARKILLVSLFLLFVFNIAAQSPDEAAKEKRERELKLLEQILADAKNLRLPENRAMVFARVGSALWQLDETRARKLFADAISETITAQTEAQNEKNGKQFFQALIYGQSPRVDIINLLGNRDAELALALLAKSRPPVIAAAMLAQNTDETSAVQQFARNEINTEQRLYVLAADQNPQLAAKRVRESLKKGVSYETLNLLRKIYAKDPQNAEKLAAEVAESYLNIDFSKSYQTSEAVGYFVAEMGKERTSDEEKSLKIADDLLRRLVLKMTDDWLGSKNNQTYGFWSCQAVVERLFPDRAALIKKKIERINSQYQNEDAQEYTRIMQQETAPDEMIARAEKLPSQYRNEIYRAAATKIAQAGNIAQAEKIMQDNASDEQAEYYLSNFYVNLSYQLIGQGKFDEANAYINRIENDEQRINALINLANSVYGRDPKENRKKAEEILAQARAAIPNAPETYNDLNAASNLAAAYAQFNADESFSLLEPMLPVLNELIQANFVLMKFRNYGGVRQGEMQLMNGSNSGVYNLENVLRVLKDKDFERALRFTNGFDRIETRILLQLQLIDENLSGIVNLPINSRQIISYGSKIRF